MDEDDEYTTETLPGIKMQVVDFVVLVLDWVRALFSVSASVFEDATQIAAQHANYQRDRRQFADEARASIEAISGE